MALNRITHVRPGDPPLAIQQNRIIDALRELRPQRGQNGLILGLRRIFQRLPLTGIQSQQVLLNASGSTTIPPNHVGEVDASPAPVSAGINAVGIRIPTPGAIQYAVNTSTGEINPNQDGWGTLAMHEPTLVAYSGSGFVVGEQCGPNAGATTLSSSGTGFTALGLPDEIEDGLILAVQEQTGESGDAVYSVTEDIYPGNVGGAVKLALVGGELVPEVGGATTIRNLSPSPLWTDCVVGTEAIGTEEIVVYHNCAVAFVGTIGDDWRCTDSEHNIEVGELSPLGGEGAPTAEVTALLVDSYRNDLEEGDTVTVWWDPDEELENHWKVIPYAFEDVVLFQLRGPLAIDQEEAIADRIDMETGELVAGGQPITVRDPLQIHVGTSSARGVAAVGENRECDYLILYLQQKARFLVGTLTGPLSEESRFPFGRVWTGSVNVYPMDGLWGRHASDARQNSNVENVIDYIGTLSRLQEGDKVIGFYDEQRDEYALVSGGSQEYGMFDGKAVNGKGECDCQFLVAVESIIRGPGPISNNVIVFDKFHQELEPNAWVDVRWNEDRRRWELAQAECPNSCTVDC